MRGLMVRLQRAQDKQSQPAAARGLGNLLWYSQLDYITTSGESEPSDYIIE